MASCNSFNETLDPEEMEDYLDSAGTRRADSSQITFQNITENELCALHDPRPALNLIKSLTDHRKEICLGLFARPNAGNGKIPS